MGMQFFHKHMANLRMPTEEKVAGCGFKASRAKCAALRMFLPSAELALQGHWVRPAD